MYMDGDTIHIGDSVHDVLYGDGTVTEFIAADRMRVKFPSHENPMTYRTNGVGVRYQKRTLYWADPIAVVPPKNSRVWTVLRRTFATFAIEARSTFGAQL